MSAQTKTKKPTKQKAPNWVTYFGRAKKKIKVIYLIEFRARNKSRTCYTSLKKIADACECSVDTVYDAVTLAISIGILEKIHYTTVFGANASGGLLWNKQVLLTWVGDTAQTAGEEAFGTVSPFFASENPVSNPAKNPVYNLIQGTSLKEKKEEVSSPLFSRVREELKGYTKNQVNEFWEALQERYKGKERFLAEDLNKHIDRFKHDNPLKYCTSCGEIREAGGALCDSCAKYYQQKEKERELERDRELGFVELPRAVKVASPARVQEIAQLERLLKSYLEGADLLQSQYRQGLLGKEAYESLQEHRRVKIQELEKRLLRLKE